MRHGNFHHLEGTRPCPTGKAGIASEKLAVRALKDLAKRQKRRRTRFGLGALPVEAYRYYSCDECAQFHTTSTALPVMRLPRIPSEFSLKQVLEIIRREIRYAPSGLLFPSVADLSALYPPHDGVEIRKALISQAYLRRDLRGEMYTIKFKAGRIT